MRIFPRKNQPVLAYVLGFGFVALAGQANAGCLSGLAESAAPSKSSTPSAPASSPPLIQAAYRLDPPSAPKFLRASDRNDDGDDNEPIVGLWQFVLNGGMDFGTQAWHSDGTELMFSAGRDPAKGDVCQGVWRKIGPRTYTLNHIAMGYDDGFPAVPLYRVHIHCDRESRPRRQVVLRDLRRTRVHRNEHPTRPVSGGSQYLHNAAERIHQRRIGSTGLTARCAAAPVAAAQRAPEDRVPFYRTVLESAAPGVAVQPSRS